MNLLLYGNLIDDNVNKITIIIIDNNNSIIESISMQLNICEITIPYIPNINDSATLPILFIK